MRCVWCAAAVLSWTALPAWPQEAALGFDLRATLSAALYEGSAAAAAPRDGSPWVAGARAVFYPTLKLDDHWSVSGAVQVHSRPYFAEEMQTQGYGIKADVLQATLNYSRFWSRGSIVVRTGVLNSAFGSFLLRYDDALSPMINAPQAYGYYYAPVSTLGLAGAEVSGSYRKLDARGQFVNSSAANRRSIFSHDQYGGWAGGGGYTIRQGLRLGAFFYSGPYLDRHSPFFFPGEAPPHQLPARAFGLDGQWAAGYWNVQGELQRFVMEYRLIPTFREEADYLEVRRVLHPRWFVAQRSERVTNTVLPPLQVYEVVAGFRPDARQIVKAGYGVEHSAGLFSRRFQLQLVTTLHPVSMSRN